MSAKSVRTVRSTDEAFAAIDLEAGEGKGRGAPKTSIAEFSPQAYDLVKKFLHFTSRSIAAVACLLRRTGTLEKQKERLGERNPAVRLQNAGHHDHASRRAVHGAPARAEGHYGFDMRP
jgi:hypothetical protein